MQNTIFATLVPVVLLAGSGCSSDSDASPETATAASAPAGGGSNGARVQRLEITRGGAQLGLETDIPAAAIPSEKRVSLNMGVDILGRDHFSEPDHLFFEVGANATSPGSYTLGPESHWNNDAYPNGAYAQVTEGWVSCDDPCIGELDYEAVSGSLKLDTFTTRLNQYDSLVVDTVKGSLQGRFVNVDDPSDAADISVRFEYYNEQK